MSIDFSDDVGAFMGVHLSKNRLQAYESAMGNLVRFMVEYIYAGDEVAAADLFYFFIDPQTPYSEERFINFRDILMEFVVPFCQKNRSEVTSLTMVGSNKSLKSALLMNEYKIEILMDILLIDKNI